MLIRDLGLIDYALGLEVQDLVVNEVVAGGSSKETLLVCEHPEVITIGRALESEKEVFTKDIPLFEVPRGGRSTLHLPGQIVVYPILNLEKRGRDLHAYMRLLESAIVLTLADFRIDANSVEGKTGVWVRSGTKKIASIGIAVKKWVSYHGLALNVTCDLKKFSGLSPCGFESNVMTSVFEEMSDDYKVTWKITQDSLLKNVKTRLVEVLKEVLIESATELEV